MIGLIHPESHFTDERARFLRGAAYRRLRRHWQFVNELQLFEVHHNVTYGVHIYGDNQDTPRFLMACSLYHPDTVIHSLDHDGAGSEPGLKNLDGKWDLRPHRNRISTVTDRTLATWHAILESPSTPIEETRMLYAVNQSNISTLDIISHSRRAEGFELKYSPGWHEKNDRTKGYFEASWGSPASWKDAILQGPHLFVSTPAYKTPNRTMLNNQDWSATDLERLPPDYIPTTAYKPAIEREIYDRAYTRWGPGESNSARSFYRIAWRYMAANSGERTLISSIIPPGAAHTDGIMSAIAPSNHSTVLLTAFTSSIILDLVVRSAPKSTIRSGTINRLPVAFESTVECELILRTLRLNCVTSAYADLWNECYSSSFHDDTWTDSFDHARRNPIGQIRPEWDSDTPLRAAADRRQALVEIDTLVAVALGLTAEELCTIYRTQFPVLYGHDRNMYYYDVNGRLVPNSVLSVWRKIGNRITKEERTATNQAGNTYTYELPFVTLDREADMRQAYAHFERLIKERS